MSDDFRDMSGQTPDDFAVPHHSRSAGITSYRKRRRRNRMFRCAVALILIAIIGSAALLFCRPYLDYDKLPFDIPGLTTSEKESEEATAAKPVGAATMTVAAAGDVILNGAALESGLQGTGSYNFDHLFANLSGELNQYNLRLVNQETALAGSAIGFGNTWPLNAPQELGRAEIQSGFNVILRANDHTIDAGREGIHTELSWWHSEFPDTPILGIAEPDPVANPGLSDYVTRVFTVDREGFRIAILNHAYGIAETEHDVISTLDEAKVRADVQKARDLGAEMIVACPHWGTEGSSEITDLQKTYARLYCDLGVDVIVGTHPRVLQPVEVMENASGHKTVCFYSLGCLTSSLNPENFLGGIAEFTLARDDQGTCSITSAVLKPVVTRRAAGRDYTSYLLSDYNDDLAWAGWDGLTVETLSNSCASILGAGYDRAAAQYKVDLSGAETTPAPAPAPAQAETEPTPAEQQPEEQAQPAPAEEAPQANPQQPAVEEQPYGENNDYGYDYGYDYGQDGYY